MASRTRVKGRPRARPESGGGRIQQLWTFATLSVAQGPRGSGAARSPGTPEVGRGLGVPAWAPSEGSASSDPSGSWGTLGPRASISDLLHSPPQHPDHSQQSQEAELSSSEVNEIETQSHSSPHRAYLAEQQSQLPLPLTCLMEEEVLDILTKALQSYRSDIGRDHLLTHQVEQRIEELKNRVLRKKETN
ncbi:cation channel sperm-associated protein subunit zeta isoform X2 [Tachyglossus aculeatus]|uniref:cation channel sperm-associated protein subunit zeta isoform X2 n=1 Tax=Tachyglossus aculeatus TaxID=9261 RepID=UPI0018F79FDB|nr:cation channel sperm-associated protein subunit zeta isoform X2 [Tachyglossus aculeatus]